MKRDVDAPESCTIGLSRDSWRGVVPTRCSRLLGRSRVHEEDVHRSQFHEEDVHSAGYGYWIWRVALRLFAGLENRTQKQESRKPNGGESVSSAVASGGLFTLTGRYDSAVCLRTLDALVPAAHRYPRASAVPFQDRRRRPQSDARGPQARVGWRRSVDESARCVQSHSRPSILSTPRRLASPAARRHTGPGPR